MSRVDLERDFWNEAALDPEVDVKYISDISTEEMIEALGEIPVEGTIIDLGCGVGRITNALSENGHSKRKIIGIDISDEMLHIADLRRRDKLTMIKWNSVDYRLTDGRIIPYKGEADFIYSMLVFQHLKADTIQSYMKETYRVLKPEGIFRFQFIEGAEQEPFSNHYELNQMKTWLEDAGLEIIKVDKGLVHPMWTWITARKP